MARPFLSLRSKGGYVGGQGPLPITVGFLGAPIQLDLRAARVAFSDPDRDATLISPDLSIEGENLLSLGIGFEAVPAQLDVQ